MKESLQLGSWELFSRPVLGMSLCHPFVGRSALLRSGFHIQLSSLLAWPLCVSLSPTKEWVLALLLLVLLPLALPWGLVCFGGLAMILSLGRFHALVFHAWGACKRLFRKLGFPVWATGVSSGCLRFSASRLSGGAVESLVSDIAVRVLLLATSLPLGMDFSLAPGRCLSVRARWSSSGHPTYVFFFSDCTLRPGLGLD